MPFVFIAQHQQECIPVGCVLPAHLSYPGGMSAWGVCWGGVPCDLSHHALDITCLLSLLQLRLKSNAGAYIVLVM